MAEFVNYNGFPISTDTPLGKELQRWERPSNYRPENHPYPKMLYKAYKGSDGVIRCMDTDPVSFRFADMGVYQREIDRIKHFNESCQKIVKGPEEEKDAFSNGWRETAKEAEAAQMSWEHDMQQAAAERAYQDRNMSEKAKAEIAAAEVATMDPLAEVPEKRRGPGRPRVKPEAA